MHCKKAQSSKVLRPVLFFVQVMSDIYKQDYIHNKWIHQCTKMRICISLNVQINVKEWFLLKKRL